MFNEKLFLNRIFGNIGQQLTFFERVSLLFLFLASLNFIDLFAYWIFAAFATFVLAKNKKLNIHFDCVLFLLFSISLILFWRQGNSNITAILKTLIYPMCFIMGYNFLPYKISILKREYCVKYITFILALGTWFHLLLNYLINHGRISDRITIDIWSGQVLNATGQAAFACLMLAVSLAVLFSDFRVRYKTFFLVALIVILSYNMILAGRTLLVMTVFSALALFYNYAYNNKFDKTIMRIVLMIVLCLLLVLFLYSQNFCGIQDIIKNTNMYNRFFSSKDSMAIDDDPRMEFKLKYLKYLLTFPFGGGKIREIVGSYAHDAYLDTYDEAGIFAFIFIILIMIRYAFKTIRIIKNKSVSFDIKQLCISLFIVINIEFFVEPILVGMPWLLAIFCIIYGLITRLECSLPK